MRIGILGGTFDPVHIGHLVAAVNARDELVLDKVLMVVANQPWQKIGMRTIAPAEIRLKMLSEAVKGIHGISACDIEIKRGGLSYTADTVSAVKKMYLPDEIYLLVGADVASELSTWERVEEFQKDVQLVVISRPSEHVDGSLSCHSCMEEEKLAGNLLGWRASSMAIPALYISSSMIRERVRNKKSLDFLVPPSVIDIIIANRLYC